MKSKPSWDLSSIRGLFTHREIVESVEMDIGMDLLFASTRRLQLQREENHILQCMLDGYPCVFLYPDKQCWGFRH